MLPVIDKYLLSERSCSSYSGAHTIVIIMRGTDSPKSVIVDKLEETIQGIDLDDVVIAINQSRARAS